MCSFLLTKAEDQNGLVKWWRAQDRGVLRGWLKDQWALANKEGC